jgi:hypothetical protein
MPMRIVGEGMAVPEHEAAPPVAMTEAAVARVVEPRAEAVPDELAMAEAMMPDKAVAMTPEAGMAEAMSAAAEVTAATAAEVAAAAATAMTRAELVDAGRQRLHRVHV